MHLTCFKRSRMLSWQEDEAFVVVTSNGKLQATRGLHPLTTIRPYPRRPLLRAILLQQLNHRTKWLSSSCLPSRLSIERLASKAQYLYCNTLWSHNNYFIVILKVNLYSKYIYSIATFSSVGIVFNSNFPSIITES